MAPVDTGADENHRASRATLRSASVQLRYEQQRQQSKHAQSGDTRDDELKIDACFAEGPCYAGDKGDQFSATTVKRCAYRKVPAAMRPAPFARQYQDPIKLISQTSPCRHDQAATNDCYRNDPRVQVQAVRTDRTAHRSPLVIQHERFFEQAARRLSAGQPIPSQCRSLFLVVFFPILVRRSELVLLIRA